MRAREKCFISDTAPNINANDVQAELQSILDLIVRRLAIVYVVKCCQKWQEILKIYTYLKVTLL